MPLDNGKCVECFMDIPAGRTICDPCQDLVSGIFDYYPSNEENQNEE
jgi:hypothetical protein